MIVPVLVRRIYFNTSFFIFIPAIMSYNTDIMFSMLLLILGVTSMANWISYKHGSFVHLLDKFLSCIVMLVILSQHPHWFWAIGLALLSFWQGRHLYFEQQAFKAARFHLLFRYLIFWCCFLHANGTIPMFTFALLTFIFGLFVRDLAFKL